jgi:hypothetical protein
MDAVGTSKWKDVYKRTLFVDGATNIGIEADPKLVAAGDGTNSPLLLGAAVVGVSGTQKFFFGDQGIYLRKERTGVLGIHAGTKIVVTAPLSLEQTVLGTVVSAGDFRGTNANVSKGYFGSFETTDFTACNVVGTTKVITPMLSAEDFSGLNRVMSWW